MHSDIPISVFETFIEAAKKETYFNNTIFVFVGDHGIRGDAGNMFPKAWEADGLTTQHVPLLFYSPSLLAPQRINRTCSQLDLLPSVTALAKISFVNTTLGKNLFDTVQKIMFVLKIQHFYLIPISNK